MATFTATGLHCSNYLRLCYDSQKTRKERGNSYWKNEKISRQKEHKDTEAKIIDVFLDQESKCLWTHGKDSTTWEVWSAVFTVC